MTGVKSRSNPHDDYRDVFVNPQSEDKEGMQNTLRITCIALDVIRGLHDDPHGGHPREETKRDTWGALIGSVTISTEIKTQLSGCVDSFALGVTWLGRVSRINEEPQRGSHQRHFQGVKENLKTYPLAGAKSFSMYKTNNPKDKGSSEIDNASVILSAL
nr:hypothetical protein [Tanacetum cinerariifolium]